MVSGLLPLPVCALPIAAHALARKQLLPVQVLWSPYPQRALRPASSPALGHPLQGNVSVDTGMTMKRNDRNEICFHHATELVFYPSSPYSTRFLKEIDYPLSSLFLP